MQIREVSLQSAIKYFIWGSKVSPYTITWLANLAGVNHQRPLICQTLHHKITHLGSRHKMHIPLESYKIYHESRKECAFVVRSKTDCKLSFNRVILLDNCISFGTSGKCIGWLEDSRWVSSPLATYQLLLFLISSLKSLQYLRLISVTQIILMSVRIRIISAVLWPISAQAEVTWPIAARSSGHVTRVCRAAVMSADKLNIKL